MKARQANQISLRVGAAHPSPRASVVLSGCSTPNQGSISPAASFASLQSATTWNRRVHRMEESP